MTVAQDFELVRAYLALASLRMGTRLTVDLQMEPATAQLPVPPLMLQTLVENAIQHGIGNKRGGGTVTIATREEPDNWLITVQDDGCGTDNIAADGLPPQQEGGFIGLANVRQRVESIARGRLHFSSIKNKGATVTVVLPKER